MKQNKKLYATLLILSMIIIAGCSTQGNIDGNTVATSKDSITIFKSSSCGCCDIYSKYMEKNGFDVKIVETQNLAPIKKEYNIPPSIQSCHTTVIGDYFIEGHVPVEAIEKLLTEKPDIAGIGMSGMPSGSPGMPGAKKGPFVIYAVHKDGAIIEFMRI